MKKIVSILSVLCFCFGLGLKAQVVTVSGDITSNTTWTSNNIYQLTGGFVYVTNNATLTIEPGTIIKGNQAALVITRGSKIIAAGTPSRPIVFTSYQSAGNRATGDWGGILLLGRAPINDPAGFRLAEGGIDPVKGQYGGTDINDNSGVLQYVRIEFAGIAFQPNNETNGLTCGGVGLGTTLDHIQVSFGGDDSFEWFGGTVNAKYLIAYRGLDDEFDTDYGWSGRLQFALSLRDSSLADVSGSNAFESDNDATGTTNAPLTSAVISNLTIVGPRRTATTTVNTNYKRAAHLRRSTSQSVYNSIIMGYPTGLKIEGQTTWNNAVNNSLQWKNNILAGCTNPYDSAGLTTGPTTYFLNWYNANGNSTLANVSDLQLTNAYNWTNPNLQPLPGSPALSGANFSSPKLNNPFFTPTTYRGAFDGTNDWTSCWANWDPQNTPYTTPGIDNLPLAVNASGNTTFCQGGSVTLTANASGATYQWSNGSTNSSINVTTAGSYTVTATNSGCSAISTPITVTVNPAPSVSVTPSGPTTFCQGGNVILTSSSASSYSWTNNSTSQSILVNSTGSYIVTVTDANGCTNASTPITVTVNPLPIATATANGSTSFCTGDSVEICASGGISYLWSNAETSNCIVVNATGTYSVQATDANGCTSPPSNNVNVIVSATPPPSMNVVGDTLLCDGETVEICSSPADSYQWSNGETTQCIIVGAAGTYNVNVTNANQCDGVGQSADVTITVNPAPTAGYTFSGNFPTINFNNTSTGATTWAWDFGDGNSSAQQNPVHFYQSSGAYTVCLVAENANGCTDTSCTTLNLTVGIESPSFRNILVQPNPSSETASILFNLEHNAQVTLSILDVAGKVVNEQHAELSTGQNQMNVDVSTLPAGIYLARLATEQGVSTLRLVVKH